MYYVLCFLTFILLSRRCGRAGMEGWEDIGERGWDGGPSTSRHWNEALTWECRDGRGLLEIEPQFLPLLFPSLSLPLSLPLCLLWTLFCYLVPMTYCNYI